MSAVCLLRGGSSVPHPVAFGDGLRSCCGCVCEVHFLPSMRTAGPACLFGLMVSRPSHQLFGGNVHGLPRCWAIARMDFLEQRPSAEPNRLYGLPFLLRAVSFTGCRHSVFGNAQTCDVSVCKVV